MSDSLYQRAKRLGITDDELGISTNADAMAAAPELAAQETARKIEKAAPKPMNSMPIPAGTPGHLVPLYRAIPHEKAKRYEALYAKFTQKDHTLIEFSIEMECVTNQSLIQSDLDDLMATREMRKTHGF